MSCDNLCTAAKCQELEARLGRLELIVDLLEASFETHVSQPIPTAHDYEEPEVSVSLAVGGNDLKVFVKVGNKSGDETVALPENEPEVGVSLAVADNQLKVFVEVGNKNDSETIALPKPEVTLEITESSSLNFNFKVGVNGISASDILAIQIPEPEPPEPPEVTVDIFELDDGRFAFKVGVDGQFDKDILTLPELKDKTETTVSVGVYRDENNLVFNVSVNGESDTDTVSLPKIEPPVVTVDVSPINESEFTIKIGVDDEFDEDILTIETMSCTDLEDLIKELDKTITKEFDTLDVSLKELEDRLNLDIDEIKEAVTVDISGEINSTYSCKFDVDNKLNPIPGYAKSITTSKDYQGIGLQGIHENLKIINANLDALHSDICKAVDPISTITVDDLYKFCSSSSIKREDYPPGTTGDKQYEDAVLQYLTDLFAESKYAYLLDGIAGDKLVTAPNNWITNYLTDFSLIQGKINNTSICNLDDGKILDYVLTIYKILGGGVWLESGKGINKTVSLPVKPETKIKSWGEQLYAQDSSLINELTATNLLDLNNIYEAVNYYRSGFHRLPAKTLKSLINSEGNNEEITIYDTFSWQEYLIKQVDALIGEFPIKIKHLTLDPEGGEVKQDIEINNISVAIAEILALNLGITHDADTSINIGMKTLVEARNAANAAIVGVDYAKANAEYLGYKGNQAQREVDCTFTPNAKDLRRTLKPSKQKIVGWENNDKETLIELIKKTLIGTEIIKAALFHPYENGGTVTGDDIKATLNAKESKDGIKWEEFKQRINNPSGRYQVPKPKAKIRDLTINDEPTP